MPGIDLPHHGASVTRKQRGCWSSSTLFAIILFVLPLSLLSNPSLAQIDVGRIFQGDVHQTGNGASDGNAGQYTGPLTAVFRYRLVIDQWTLGEGRYNGNVVSKEKEIPDGPCGTFTVEQGTYKGLIIYSSWENGQPVGSVEFTLPNGWQWQCNNIKTSDVIGKYITGHKYGQEITFEEAWRQCASRLDPTHERGEAEVQIVIIAKNEQGEPIDAFVWEGDKVLGQAGKKLALSPGPHRLRLQYSGYTPLPLDLVAQSNKEYTAVLFRAATPIAITTRPAHVLISIFQPSSGSTVPIKTIQSDDMGTVLGLALAPGTYQLVASSKGWKSINQTLAVPKDKLDLNIALSPEPYLLNLTVTAGNSHDMPVDVLVENTPAQSFSTGQSKQLVLPAHNPKVVVKIVCDGYEPVAIPVEVSPGASGSRVVALKENSNPRVSASTEIVKSIEDDAMVFAACESGDAKLLEVGLGAYRQKIAQKLPPNGAIPTDPKVLVAFEKHYFTLATKALAAYLKPSILERDGRFLEVARSAVFHQARIRQLPADQVVSQWLQKNTNDSNAGIREYPWHIVSPCGEYEPQHPGIRISLSPPQKTLILHPQAKIAALLPARVQMTLGWIEKPLESNQTIQDVLGLSLCLVPEGEAGLQLPSSDIEFKNESFRHPFYMGQTEITFGTIAQYALQRHYYIQKYPELQKCLAPLPADFLPPGLDNLPAAPVPVDLAYSVCNWLSIKCDLDPAFRRNSNGVWLAHKYSAGFRLPTPAQWQYAARYGMDIYPLKGGISWLARKEQWTAMLRKGGVAKLPVDLVYYYRSDSPPRAISSESTAYPLGFYDLCGNLKEIVATPTESNAITIQLIGGSLDEMDPNAVMPWSLVDDDPTELRRGFRVIIPCTSDTYMPPSATALHEDNR